MSETPQTPETQSESIERLPFRYMDVRHFSDMLHEMGDEDQAVRYYGLLNESSDTHIRNDNSYVLQDLENVTITQEVNETVRQAIEVALITAQEAYEAYVEETLHEYRLIPFDQAHVCLTVGSERETVRGVAAHWNKAHTQAQLMLQTDSGAYTQVSKHRLTLDIARLPQDIRQAALRYAEENGLY